MKSSIIFSLITVLTIPTLSWAQPLVKKGNKSYDSYNYSEAADKFEGAEFKINVSKRCK